MKINLAKINQSTRRTIDALYNAFESLLQKEKFEDIKVAELCAIAKVPRSTFYSYFEDKYDFLSYFNKRFNLYAEFNFTIDNFVDKQRRHEAFDFLLDYLDLRADVYKAITAINHEGEFAFANQKYIKQSITNALLNYDKITFKLPASVIAEHLSSFYYVFWSSWLHKKPGLTKANLYEYADGLIDGILRIKE